MILLLVLVVDIVPTSQVAADRHVPAWCLQTRQDVTALVCETIIQSMKQMHVGCDSWLASMTLQC